MCGKIKRDIYWEMTGSEFDCDYCNTQLTISNTAHAAVTALQLDSHTIFVYFSLGMRLTNSEWIYLLEYLHFVHVISFMTCTLTTNRFISASKSKLFTSESLQLAIEREVMRDFNRHAFFLVPSK